MKTITKNTWRPKKIVAKTDYENYVGDFETTVYEGQTSTEVWASAVVKLGTEDVQIFTSIEDTWDYLASLDTSLRIYYHNLKFDGSFWLSFFLRDSRFKLGVKDDHTDLYHTKFKNVSEMANYEYTYLISEMGLWYQITVKVNNHIIKFQDSLKLLPFSVRKIGKDFETKHQKTSIEYYGKRQAHGYISLEEQEYIKNDVLVVKEAMEFMFKEGHDKMTIGSCCMEEFKHTREKTYYTDHTMKQHFVPKYDELFPDLYAQEINKDIYGDDNAGDYIRRSYHGGWCYCDERHQNQIMRNGCTADVNSLYPSVMSSESGNLYPYGDAHFWKGNIPYTVTHSRDDIYYFVRIRCKFELKDGYLPCIQIKHDFRYRATEWLKTSKVYNNITKEYCEFYQDFDGEVKESYVTMTLTMTDFALIQEHYNLIELEMLDGCWFYATAYIFDEYIDKYRLLKETSKGAKRALAKLFLNNLYGKMATSRNSSYKVAYLNDNKELQFASVLEMNKKGGYIAVGSAITSYARNFTIRHAQLNYDTFCYADTDSLHCACSPEELIDIKEHPTKFLCWKIESEWDYGKFVRQKTYIEHVVKADREDCDPHYSITCAGMPQRCKDHLISRLTGTEPKEEYRLSKMEQDFLYDEDGNIKRMTIDDFGLGLSVAGKLMPKKIEGGIILEETTFEMR